MGGSPQRLAKLAVLAASASAMLGGSAMVATRFAVPESNPLSLTFLRFLGAAVLMLAFTLPRTRIAIAPRHWPPIVLLGVLQFALFSWFFTSSLQYIPAGRAALVLSTMPLITLTLAAVMRREALSLDKAAGALIALAGVGFALGDRVAVSGSDAVRGDLLMFGAAFTGAIYNVASGYYLRKYPATMLAAVMLAAGAAALLAAIAVSGDWSGLTGFSAGGWIAVIYLMTLAGAVTFFLWIWALEHTTPSRVVITVTLNPVSATVLGALILAEPVTWHLLVGLAGIVLGITMVNWRAFVASVQRAR